MSDPETADPANPEPAPDATLRLPSGVPVDPRGTQQMDLSSILSKQLEAGNTLKLPRGAPVAGSDPARKRARPTAGEPPIRVQKVDQPAEAAGQTQHQSLRPEAPGPAGWKLPLALGGILVLGAAAYLVFSRGPAAQPGVMPPPAGSGAVSAGVQAYLEQAKAGDAHAMRMLGAMYYYGLNVPQDREKGLYWYRKAAEKGSDAARSELSRIEGGS
ncbi:MAG: SEL1-like repeat protein [Geothrix sp.]|nr:SEL1-like repeat protein [Geothrix sp.]